MQSEGPLLETLTRRLAEAPQDFLAEPRISASGKVHVAAVVGDLLRQLGMRVDPADLARFQGQDPRSDRNRLSIVLLMCWLLADEWFRQHQLHERAVLDLLMEGSMQLGAHVPSSQFAADPDRREELARFALARLGY